MVKLDVSAAKAEAPNHAAIKRLERSLYLSTLEGTAYGGMVGFGEYFTAAYAVALQATNTQIALLTSIPSLVGALVQAPAAGLTHLIGSRKPVVVIFALMQGLIWLPILGLGYLFQEQQAPILIGLVVLYSVFGGMILLPWSSAMADAVPRRVRGRYFGARTRWVTLATVVTSLAGGVLLWFLRDRGLVGFAIVFAAAFGMRMASVALLTTLFELPHSARRDQSVSPGKFVGSLLSTNLGRMILYVFLLNFAVNMAGPFFAPYMLRTLHFSYPVFTLMSVMSAVAGVWAVGHWGGAADRAGNRRMVLISGVMVSTLPLWWVFSKDPIYLGFVNFFGGVAWAGLSLTTINYIYDATTPENRTAYLAYLNTGVGIATGLGALTGGVLISYLPSLLGSAFITIFLISGCLRLLSTLALVPRIQEVRRVTDLSALEVFHLLMGGGPSHRPPPHFRLARVFHAAHHNDGHDQNPK